MNRTVGSFGERSEINRGNRVPRVSIIVPVHNAAEFVGECIDSLVAQTFQDYEIILIDDASSDGSSELLLNSALKHKPLIRVITSPDNRGSGGARNLGIRAAEGEYIAFVDADDWIAPNLLQECMNVAGETNADIVECDFIEVRSGDQRPRRVRAFAAELTGPASTAKRSEWIAHAHENLWGKVVRRSLFTDNRIEIPERLAAQDKIFSVIRALARSIEYVDAALYYYRMSNSSITRVRNSESLLDVRKTAKIVNDHFHRLGIVDEHAEAVAFFVLRCHYRDALMNALFKFDNPDPKLCRMLREDTNDLIPGWRRSSYYRRLPVSVRAIFMANSFSPSLLCAVAKATQRYGWWLLPSGIPRPKGVGKASRPVRVDLGVGAPGG